MNFRRLTPTFDQVWKVAILAALLWIGYELRQIAANVYSGPQPTDTGEAALSEIADNLAQLNRILQLK